MGLNIGIEVEEQPDGPYEEGCNPKGSDEEVEERFFEFLAERLPLYPEGWGRGWVKRQRRPWDGNKVVWDFDVRLSHYGASLGYDDSEVYGAIFQFVLREFSPIAGIKSTTYWSG